MTTTTHKRSLHIDAPVKKVFDHVKDPRHFYAAFPGDGETLSDVALTPEGVGSTYSWKSSWFAFHIDGGRFSGSFEGVMTREEYIPKERIVDHSSTGPVWTWTFEPDPTGVTLTLAFEYSTKVPLMDKVVDRIGWKGDRDLDTILANLKKAIET